MKTYKEFTKLFEATRLLSDWRKEFERVFSLRNEEQQIKRIDDLMKKMERDVLPKNIVQYMFTLIKEWKENPDKREKIQSTIYNHLSRR